MSGRDIKHHLLFLLFMSVAVNITSLNFENGQENAQFLLLNDNAAEYGRAGTGIAASVAEISLNKNPAGLGSLRDNFASVTYGNYFSDVYSLKLGFTINAKKAGVFAQELVFFSQGSVEVIDLSGSSFIPTGEIIGGQNISVSFIYGVRIIEKFHFGFLTRFINEKIDNSSDSSFSFDAGILYTDFLLKNFNIGFVGRNFGTRINIGDSAAPPPTTFGLGIRYTFLEKPESAFFSHLTGYLETDIHLRGDHEYFKWGLESHFRSTAEINFVIRLGQSLPNDTGILSSFSTGLGVYWRVLRFDYAFKSFGDLGISNLISFRFLY